MINRILDFSEAPARLKLRCRQLVIVRPDRADISVPMADLAVVVASHPRLTYTQAVLAELAESGGAFVACNRQMLPVGLLLPLVAHHAQTQRFAAQAAAPLPLRKRLWRQIVRAKIQAQGALLQKLYGTDHGLLAMIPRVRSGDPTNVESQAARRYWPHLFDNLQFRRNPDNEDQNLLLNYGYAVLRAIVGRAICAAGLHPSLGLHHHNRGNPFCLADDLMEPFRPTVDEAVVEYVDSRPGFQGLEPAAKQSLIGELTGRYMVGGEQRTLFDTVARLAGSLADVFLGNAQRLEMPDW